jgi:hypothetical protein
MTDNAKELLALADRLDRAIAIDKGDREFTCEDAGYFSILRAFYPKQIAAMSDALRLSARQQASVEDVARSLCKADGTAQCAAICLSYSSTSTTNGKCPEAKRIWGHKCRALLAEYDIFEKVGRP